jgi:hypothetical protein
MFGRDKREKGNFGMTKTFQFLDIKIKIRYIIH